jgi:FkbM family methyltransferase
MINISSSVRWVTPHGIVRLLCSERRETDSQRHSRRQRELFEQFVPLGSVVFDIRANLDNRNDALLDCGARVVAVEPQPDCVALLRSVYGARVTVVQAAVGNAVGRRPQHLSAPFDAVASLSDEYIARAQKTRRFGDRARTKAIDADVMTLDFLVSTYGVPSFIEIDVEGYDYELPCGLSAGVDVFSFEWASDSQGRAIQCLEYLSGIGLPCFQLNFGESIAFAHKSSLDLAKAKQLLISLGEEQFQFGNIYASRRPLLGAGCG